MSDSKHPSLTGSGDSLCQMTVGRLNGLSYKNTLITDICNFMNHTILLFCRRHDTAQMKVAQLQVKTASMLCGALDQDLGSLEFSPWVTLGMVNGVNGVEDPDFLLSYSYLLGI